MKKVRSFKKELIYSFLTILFFSIVFLGIFQIYQLSKLIDESKRYQAQATTYLADYIDKYILEHKRVIQTEALRVKDALEAGDTEAIHEELRDIKLNYPGFVNLYVGDRSGKSIVFYPELYTDGTNRENLNFSDRYYYKELVKTKSTVISPVYHGRGGTDALLVSIVSPILNTNGELIGYVLGGLDLNALGEHITERNSGEEGNVIVIDREKNVIVHPSVDTKRDLVNVSNSEIVQYIEKNDEVEGSNYFKLKDPNREEYITYKKIKSLDWTIWVAKPTEAITNTYKDSIVTILIFLLGTAIVMVGVSLFLTNRLEVTLRQLLDYIKNYTNGIQHNAFVTKKRQGPKEMEELFYYFNRMIDEVENNKLELLELNKELEGRVHERTVTLRNKNLELRNNHAVLLAVLESMSEGLALINNEKEVEYVNEYFLNIVAGGIKDDLLTLSCVYEQFVALFDIEHDELSAFFAKDKGELKLEYKKQQSKEQKFYVLHKFSVLLDDYKIGEGLLLRDITKEEEIDILKNNLISLTSHEFKTPITNIKGSVETLLRKEVEWEVDFQQELLEGIHEDIDRILQLVNDWMDISKIESGTMYVEREMIRADHLIEKSLDQIPKTLTTNVEFQFNNHLQEGYTFYADKLRVSQVLINLFTNALRYNDSPLKKIDVTLDANRDYTMITVSDNGIGISNDHITKIFNRFYQVDITATRRSGGTGLGLAICQGIMDAHGGEIEVISEIGKGSSFILYFPNKREEE